MNSAKVFGKQVNLTYIHPQKTNATVLESTLAFNSENKVTGKFSFQSGKGSVKYTYVNSSGTTLEPAYDFNTEAWNYTASQTLGEGNTIKLSYETSKNVTGLEWTKDFKQAGSLKVSCYSLDFLLSSLFVYMQVCMLTIYVRAYVCVLIIYCIILCIFICMLYIICMTIYICNVCVHTHTNGCT
mgnify:CR=1 FL=1